jgi:hypothetical protein
MRGRSEPGKLIDPLDQKPRRWNEKLEHKKINKYSLSVTCRPIQLRTSADWRNLWNRLSILKSGV